MKLDSANTGSDSQTPLYSTRIIKIYLEYLEATYPKSNIEAILQKSGIEKHEIDDVAHWLTQEQIDQFHFAVMEETGDDNPSRAAGRFAANSKNIGPLRQLALGLISPSTLFLAMEKIYPVVSRGAILKSKKIDINKVEIITWPTPEANEKIYQCENRIGFFEGVVFLLTDSKVNVKHDECYHKGDHRCRYIIEWEFPPSYAWKRLLKFGLIGSLPAIGLLFYLLPHPISSLAALLISLIVLGLSLKSSALEKKELISIVKNQGKVAQDHLEEISRRYKHALLFQEIGRFTTANHDADQLMEAAAVILKKHVDFESGLIVEVNSQINHLIIKAAFGVNTSVEKLKNRPIKIDHNLTNLSVIKAIQSKEPVIASQSALTLDQSWLESLGITLHNSVKSAIFLPIVYQDATIGVLCFSNHLKNTSFTESDINFLSGVASQLAIGIANSRSFQFLKESEEKYRALIEATKTGFVIIDQSGTVQDANVEYVKLAGFQKLDDIKGKKVASWTAENDLQKLENAMNAFKNGKFIKNFTVNYKNHEGDLTPIEMSAAAVSIKNSSYIMSICRDITEQKRTQEIMIQTEKMSTVGALAAGMAHELNNPLAGIIQTLQVLKTRLMGRSPEYNKVIEEHGVSLECFDSIHEKLGTIKKIDSIIATGIHAADIVNNMVNFSQKDHAEYTKHDIVNLMDRTVEIAKSDYNLKDDYDFRAIDIIRVYDPHIPEIPCASAKIQQVFLTILKNGAREMFQNRNTTTNPRFILRIFTDNGFIRIEIEDNGPGISETERNRIFEPFYSSNLAGTGTGLGLSLAYFIIKDNHNGDLLVDTAPGKGTRFVIILPIRHSKIN